MHFSAELSETLRHWCRMDTSAPVQKCETFRHQTHKVPKCLGSEVVMDDSEISILDSIRFFEKKIPISNYERFLPSNSRLVHLAQSVAAATINVANLV